LTGGQVDEEVLQRHRLQREAGRSGVTEPVLAHRAEDRDLLGAAQPSLCEDGQLRR
jgi:hypothetical protein